MMELELSMEEKISDLRDDLLTVLDGHMDVFENEELFFEAIRFITYTLHETIQNPRLSLKVLRAGMDEGMKQHLETKGH